MATDDLGTDPAVGPANEPTEPVTDDSAPADGPEPDTFPREYVEELRAEAKQRREVAADLESRVDDLSRRLVSALVAADGRLADPQDLPYDAAHIDPDALSEAITALITAKPHYGARRTSPLPEQSVDSDEPTGPTFAELLRTL